MWSAARSARLLLSKERPLSAAEQLHALAESPHAAHDDAVDVYGDGIVGELEERVAGLLGKPAALWFPTGIMAQQAVLREWASRAGTTRIAVHPLHHTQLQEDSALTTVSGLEPVILTAEHRQPLAADLDALAGPLAAAVVELPFQELGYLLPTWAQLCDFAEAARQRGTPLHLDGARLWESRFFLEHSPAEIAALADSVYVSMYKSLGGLSGGVVAGDADLIEQLRVWRIRYGGNIFKQFPAIVSALDGLDRRLDRMPLWHDHARVVADGLRPLQELLLTPDPPHISEFWVVSELPADALNRAMFEHWESDSERWIHGWWTGPDGRSVAEVTIRDPALEWTAADVTRVGRRVLDRASELAAH